MLTCLHRFRRIFQLASMLLTLLVDALRYLRLCLHPSPLSPPKISFCASNWRCIKSAISSRGVLPMPRALPSSGWLAGLTGVMPWLWCNLRRFPIGIARDSACSGGGNLAPDDPDPAEPQALTRRMARDNPTWGEERIANELLRKLGLRVSPRTVRKYIPKCVTMGEGNARPLNAGGPLCVIMPRRLLPVTSVSWSRRPFASSMSLS